LNSGIPTGVEGLEEIGVGTDLAHSVALVSGSHLDDKNALC
jgi:hypothetical protein